MGSDAEARLLARCRRGEAAAWDELFDQHYAAAGRFILQLGHDLTRDDAEELCQEVVQLRYFGDLSYDEISLALKLNHKTVSSRLSKCLDRLEEIAGKIFSGEKSAAFPSNL